MEIRPELSRNQIQSYISQASLNIVIIALCLCLYLRFIVFGSKATSTRTLGTKTVVSVGLVMML